MKKLNILFIIFFALASLNVFSKDLLFKVASFEKKEDLLILKSQVGNKLIATCSYKYSRLRKIKDDLIKMEIDRNEYLLVSKALSGIVENTESGRGLASHQKGLLINVLRDKRGAYYCHFKDSEN